MTLSPPVCPMTLGLPHAPPPPPPLNHYLLPLPLPAPLTLTPPHAHAHAPLLPGPPGLPHDSLIPCLSRDLLLAP